MSEVTARRHDVEHALGVLRLAARKELSFLPRGERWLLPAVAFALGIALAGGKNRRGAAIDPAASASPEPAPDPAPAAEAE